MENNKSNMEEKKDNNDSKIMTVFYVEIKHSVKNYEEVVKKVLENIKKFSTENKIMVKYNYVKNAEKYKTIVNEEVVEINSDHIYFKLNYSNLPLFKKYQFLAKRSDYKTLSEFTPSNVEEKEKMLKVKNSFIKITEVDGKLLLKSRVSQNSHYYLSRQIFNELKITMNNKNFVNVRSDKNKLKPSSTVVGDK